MRWAVVMWTLVGCGVPSDDGSFDTDTEVETSHVIASVTDGWLRGDLHFHTNYSEDAASQGGDDMGLALRIADAWRAPEWVDAFDPSGENHLHFIAVTDHRTVAGHSDPDFGHDYLAVVGGEEFGSDGHAGIWGQQTHVNHEVVGAESRAQRIVDAVDEAHAQGALFSPNHPTDPGDMWGWTIDGIDAMEVWNGPWGVMSAPSTEADLDGWVASNGSENPAIRSAIALTGVTADAQALRFWQNVLSLGIHVPPVGGGDRHMLLPAGLPTTTVLTESWDRDGVLAGLAAGGTFVSRSPSGPQVVLNATVEGETYSMGAALPGATEVVVSWSVSRASGGSVSFVTGEVLAVPEAPEVSHTVALDQDVQSGEFTWTPPATGGWLHAVVRDPLPTDAPASMQAAVDALTTFPDDSGALGILTGLLPLLDLQLASEPHRCNPEDWDPWSMMCMPTDTEALGSFYLGDAPLRFMNAEFEEGVATGTAMGAISAAFHTAPVSE